mmetsp:Transcript_4970/g.7394  ORF Transcript_4970/g.7394 Transcript_4970/m.7394 type:complete len:80 (+) Transcript_4970:105-344(+)
MRARVHSFFLGGRRVNPNYSGGIIATSPIQNMIHLVSNYSHPKKTALDQANLRLQSLQTGFVIGLHLLCNYFGYNSSSS